MNRRTFLTALAGSPLVFGLRELLAQDPAPDFVARALKRMKETKRFGVFIIIPETEAAQKSLGASLLARMPAGSKRGNRGYELFCANVFVCLTEEQAAKAGMGAKVGGKGLLRLLLDPQGKTVAADRSFTLDDFEDPEAFTKSFTDFTQGADGARLRDHAKAIEAGFTDELKKAAEQLRGDDAVAGKAMETLTASADVIAPWLVNRSRGEDGSKFESVLWNYYLQQSVKDPEPALPYGLRVERVAVEDPCPSCGMAAYRPVAYRFLSFLTK